MAKAAPGGFHTTLFRRHTARPSIRSGKASFSPERDDFNASTALGGPEEKPLSGNGPIIRQTGRKRFRRVCGLIV